MAEFDVKSVKNRAPGDEYFNRHAESTNALVEQNSNKMDGEAARKELRKLLEWYYFEKDKQSANRLEMSMDADFYDNMQWDPEDAQVLRDRGQMPLVYNEVAPMADWVIGTERRARVDWKVLPRSEDDVQAADVKTKVMKYVSDVNKVPFARSRAFADAVKAGVGWVDDGVRDDPTKDVIYSKYEDWRNIIHDSSSYDLDLEDARYLFRWRWVDEDIAVMMFPDRADVIRRAVDDSTHSHRSEHEEDSWYTKTDPTIINSGTLYASGVGYMADAKRRRVKLIECQYRCPVKTSIVNEGPFKGNIFNPKDQVLADHVGRHGYEIVDKVMMRMHVAVFTESHMIAYGPSIFRHNGFSLTPVWCYRRGRDRLPYGIIRRVRDIQMDLNKRASKALFMLNTNQVIADEGAVDDWNVLRDEVDRPDGLIVKKAGKELVIRRDTDGATGQLQMMTMDAQSIQKSAGVSQENLGRQTNAVSGEAIKARQLQGSVVTTEPFDHLRLATQVQGEKQLSLTEQFYTQEKVIRLTGSKGELEWVNVNVPEMQPDGTVRFLNDITGSAADFVVSEQDYSGSLRQVMFESLNQLATRMAPEVALRLMTIAMEFSDLPNKSEVADQIRKLTGERDASKPLTPEEEQQAQQQAQQQAEAIEMQRQQALQALEEQRAKVRELNAKAAKLESESSQNGGPQDLQNQDEIFKVKQEAFNEIERLSDDLRKTQMQLTNETVKINKDADTKLEVARIEADTAIRVAELQAASNDRIQKLEERLNGLSKSINGENNEGSDA